MSHIALPRRPVVVPAVGTAALTVALVGWRAGLVPALLVSVVILLLVAIGVLTVAVRRVETAVARLWAEVRDGHAHDRTQRELLVGTARGYLDELADRLVRAEARLDAVRQATDRLPDELEERVGAVANRTTGPLRSRLTRDIYARVEAHTDLRLLIGPRAPMPSFDGWALNADVMHAVATTLWDRRPSLVVECGSGASSVWLGYLVERLGTGRVVALEHDDHYLQASRDLVRGHGLQQVVEIRHAPLTTWTDDAGDGYQWYATEAIDDLADIDLLLVDGPPGKVGRQARYPAGPLLIPRCRESAVVVLDDTGRSDEKAISDRWLAEWPGLGRTVRGQGTAHVLARNQPATR